MQVSFRGIFLTSDQPAATADFYREVAGQPLEAVGDEGQYIHWRLDRDGMQLAIHHAAAFASYTHPPLAGSNLTHLYFKIDDRDAFLARLTGLGVEPSSVDDVVVTVMTRTAARSCSVLRKTASRTRDADATHSCVNGRLSCRPALCASVPAC